MNKQSSNACTSRMLRHQQHEAFWKHFDDNLKEYKREHSTEKLKELDRHLQLGLRDCCCQKDISTRYLGSDKETLLHLVVREFDKEKCKDYIPLWVKQILEKNQSLALAGKEGVYEGQTALHIAVSKGNYEAVKAMLQSVDKKMVPQLLRKQATGAKFAHTVMMGELPLFVAALTLNEDIVELLIDRGAQVNSVNSQSDNVFHSLIRYAAINPDKLEGILKMCQLLNKKLMKGDDRRSVWMQENNKNLTPLRLAASLGLVDIFQFIMEIDGVYRVMDNQDGVIDVYKYDVTEIDEVALWKATKHTHEAPALSLSTNVDQLVVLKQTQKRCCPSIKILSKPPKSVLSLICRLPPAKALPFFSLPVVQKVIEKKWKHYKKMFYPWIVFHFIWMLLLSVYAIEKNKVINKRLGANISTSGNTPPTDGNELFVEIISVMAIILSIVYITLELICTCAQRRKWHVTLVHHNGMFRAALMLFSVLMVVDSTWFHIKPHNSYCLVLALPFGWWFLTIFLRAFKKFSFYIVLLKKVLRGDIVRFIVFAAPIFVSFSLVMHILFNEVAPVPDGFRNEGISMLTMFRLLLGLADMEDFLSARTPEMAIFVFVIFVLLTYVLLLNSLIALLSQTCTHISENRYSHWQMQRLTVILMLECMMTEKLAKAVGKLMNERSNQPRYWTKIGFIEMQDVKTRHRKLDDVRNLCSRVEDLLSMIDTVQNTRKKKKRPEKKEELSPQLCVASELPVEIFTLSKPSPILPGSMY